MKKKALVFFGIIFSVLFLSGCSTKSWNQNETKNQEMNQETNQDQRGFGNGQGNQNGQGRNDNGQPGGFMGSQSEEARSACSGKAEGDNCSFTSNPQNGQDSRELTGICAKSLNNTDDTISCRPGRVDNNTSQN